MIHSTLSSQYFNKTFRLKRKKRERKGQARQLEPSPQRLTEEAATVSCGHVAGTGQHQPAASALAAIPPE